MSGYICYHSIRVGVVCYNILYKMQKYNFFGL